MTTQKARSAAERSQVAHAAVAAMKVKGMRVTQARLAVVEALARIGHHPSVEELYDEVVRQQPAVHLATVYRTVDALREAGIVEHTHLSHGPAVVKLTSMDHEHAVCEKCGEVTDVPASLFAPLRARLKKEFGFEVGAQHFAMSGRCRRCSLKEQ